MIISDLKDSRRIETLHPLFTELFNYVKSHDILHAPLGRIDIDGDNLYINNSQPECKSKEEQNLELHYKYIDVQILLEGHETIGWKATNSLDANTVVTPYDDKGDFALYHDQPTTYIDLQPGQFAIFYPEDAHAPIIGKGKIRKMVAKVRL
jgi:YhcH/YjgK/YiaL family protein